MISLDLETPEVTALFDAFGHLLLGGKFNCMPCRTGFGSDEDAYLGHLARVHGVWD